MTARFLCRFPFPPSALAAFLALAMLFAQWAGLQHGIAHSEPASDRLHVAAFAADDDGSARHAHSCDLFEAAALGAALHSSFKFQPCIRVAAPGMQDHPPAFRDAGFVSHFSPRAPPLA